MLAPTLFASVVLVSAPSAARGDEPPPGLPWLRTYAEAKRDALRKGRPVCVYFTKTY